MVDNFGNKSTVAAMNELISGHCLINNGNESVTKTPLLTQTDTTLADTEYIQRVLKEAGIDSYEPQVVSHLLLYIEKHINNIISHSKIFMEHAGRSSVTVADAKLAIQTISKTSVSRMRLQKLIKLARHHNRSELPPIQEKFGLRVPMDGSVLTQPNYRMKSSNLNYSSNFPFIDLTNKQNQVMSLNSKRTPSSSSTVIRSYPANLAMRIPLHLAPQRIAVKPQISIPLNIKNQVEQDGKKRHKFED